VFSDAALTRLIEQNELYPSERRSRTVADVMHRFREDISFRRTPGGLQVSFTYPNSQKAQEVSAELVDRLIDENLAVREQEAEEERMNPQAPSRDYIRSSERFCVTDRPHAVPVGANLIEMLSLGLGGGALAGIAIAVLRRRIQPVH
jgi:hypothetical protein